MNVARGLDARENPFHRVLRGTALLALLLPACGRESPTEGDDTGNGSQEACNTDEACSAWQICEEAECVSGDRDVDFATAIPTFQVQDRDGPPSAIGYLTPAGDVDYYAYTSTGDDWLDIRTRPLVDDDEGIDTVVAVYDAGGALHAWMDDYATGRVTTWDSVLQVYLPAAGTWYVTVEDRSTFFDLDDGPRGGDDFGYDLYVLPYGSTTSETDTVDDPSIDIDITSGSSIWSFGVNLGAGDSDWATATMPWGDAPLEIWGQPEIPGSPAVPLVNLYASDGTELASKEGVGPEGLLVYPPAQSTTYTLQATDAAGAGGDDYWYVLYLRTRDEGASYDPELEPNDSTAQVLPQQTLQTSNSEYERAWVYGTLDPSDDVDVFSFPSTATKNISVRCMAANLGSLGAFDLELLDPSGTSAATATVDTAGDYDILNHEVSGAAGDWTVQLTAAGTTPVYGPGAYYRCLFFTTPFEVVP